MGPQLLETGQGFSEVSGVVPVDGVCLACRVYHVSLMV